MASELFARAKGPRVPVRGEFDLPCPWCGADCTGVAGEWREETHQSITGCPDCGKEFLCPDEAGELVCVGLLSPADMKYLASKGGDHG